jgi:copper chaperone
MQTEQLKITGMTCGGCTSKLTHVLEAVSGVRDVEVTLSTGEATVQYDERQTTPQQLRSAIVGAGYGVNGAAAPAGPHAKVSCCS